MTEAAMDFCLRRLNMGAEVIKKISQCQKMKGEERGGDLKL